MARLTPMMQAYVDTKAAYPDTILFYRLGDFYEMFFEDAKTVSRELELTLTGKDCGLSERAPMCGIPHHACEPYLNRLVEKGYKVAICEQVGEASSGKGLMKREVARIVTPGTNIMSGSLEESKNNYLMCIAYTQNHYGISVVDVSTGDYHVTELSEDKKLLDEIARFAPAEIICNDAFFMSGIDIEDLKNRQGIVIYPLEAWYFDDDTTQLALTNHFKVKDLKGLGLEDFSLGVTAAGALLRHLYDTQKNALSHLSHIRPYRIGGHLILDGFTRRNLELTETLREKQKRGSLLWVLDQTKTAMGARMLRSVIEEPLVDKEAIIRRQDALSELNEQPMLREEMREYLNGVYDMERLMGRISYQSASPRDLIAFHNSVSMIPAIKLILGDFKANLLKELFTEMDELPDLCSLIETAIDPTPPLSVREGGIIRDGYHEEVDRLRKAKTEGKQWLMELEEQEKEATGIKNLKIRYNKVFGYYLEVTNSFKSMVPQTYVRKQTLANAERYITPKLKELEDVILGAEDRLMTLEYDLFCQVREQIKGEVLRIGRSAKAIAYLDLLISLAVAAEKNNYCRPLITEDGSISIKDGRHPVVEKMIPNDMFIANDCYLDHDSQRISIITGPNMAGKSTYMRQVALIVLMAQIGSFIPASSAQIGIVDRIFTRVGASDDLASGQSTFMVEMTEVANILRNATENSLLILDEIGRGTSTFDGLSIAWAVVEYISNPGLLGAKTLFATHYHELTELEGHLSNVNNYCIAVKENGDDIVFLRKIIPGGADRSYGIAVAKLAGVPDPVIERAKQIAKELSDHDLSAAISELHIEKKTTKKKAIDEVDCNQISLFDTVGDDAIIREIKEMDLGQLTPIESLNFLYQVQGKIKNRW
ncbi:DNA mismatch repair protein MutS [Clostridia bacterium]|nr:DNA mismatch repair protein MutS [Clostridia bacterium]